MYYKSAVPTDILGKQLNFNDIKNMSVKEAKSAGMVDIPVFYLRKLLLLEDELHRLYGKRSDSTRDLVSELTCSYDFMSYLYFDGGKEISEIEITTEA